MPDSTSSTRNRTGLRLRNSRNQLAGGITPFPCAASKPDFFDHAPGRPTMFTDAEARATSERYSIERFKVVGRGVAFGALLESLASYLVKPDYRDAVKLDVLRLMRNR